MNWLAHLFLSEPTAAFRLGNVLPDLADPRSLRSLPPEIQRGIECHRRIDAFTDQHEIVTRSCQRIRTPYRRYAGILIDVFYDHFLARDWNRYSPVPLNDFAAEVYSNLRAFDGIIPASAALRIREMAKENYLCSYRTLTGVEQALGRIQGHLRCSLDLTRSVDELRRNSNNLEGDFGLFFPELCRYVGGS